ncbi:MAG TPA: class II fructose-bisphosphate aldolase [Terriglobia bacterium]|nr:class II fructose-bisphosphate aldolase [Terriglobia bacterium]
MAIASMKELLIRAQRESYAVCYCEAWNLESFQAVIEAAEEAESPIIAGFNGGFLMHEEREKAENLAYYSGMRMALQESSVPIVFLLNESDDYPQIARAIELGFNAVMVENEHLSMEHYLPLVSKVVRHAHEAGVSVEAAVGRLADGAGHVKAERTDPILARQFVEETGIDALGVAVGNVHILTRGEATIDLEVLESIHHHVPVPLVLHGGTGIQLRDVRNYINRGVAKINFGTVLKQAYLAAAKQALTDYREPMSPHPFIGIGGKHDVLMAGRKAIKEKVKELLVQCGSAGKAWPDQGATARTKM